MRAIAKLFGFQLSIAADFAQYRHRPNQPNALREHQDITPPFSLTTGVR
jgi:hypothetical protein